ncbi:acyltransferase [Psychroserpens sp. SPM9]|uniref:acyltransferase n=1 Tax=Psychroserpens sp. SPM9 TaxID=2975598 RepID=UPI0024344FBF|nr:acyltransferase [Psychroserpens sp. SPM9]MDG5490140.1 acyltransferase [Psychroserpens sp. SPM9]
MLLKDLINKRKFDKSADRLGPDIPFTHWKLFFKKSMLKLCKKKFKSFSDSSEFRPGAYAVVCSKISIGERVVIRPGTMLFADPRENGAGITIEDDVLIGSCVHFYVGNHNFENPNIPIINQGHTDSQPILLKKGCWVGANVTILPGVEIGENSVVGAGSVVTKSIPSGVVAVGNPAKVI